MIGRQAESIFPNGASSQEQHELSPDPVATAADLKTIAASLLREQAVGQSVIRGIAVAQAPG